MAANCRPISKPDFRPETKPIVEENDSLPLYRKPKPGCNGDGVRQGWGAI
jgi:hypothetical protein